LAGPRTTKGRLFYALRQHVVVRDGITVEDMRDHLVWHPVHVQAMKDSDARYGVKGDATYHVALTQLMLDLKSVYGLETTPTPETRRATPIGVALRFYFVSQFASAILRGVVLRWISRSQRAPPLNVFGALSNRRVHVPVRRASSRYGLLNPGGSCVLPPSC